MNKHRAPALLLALVALAALLLSGPREPSAQTNRYTVHASSPTTMTATGRSLAVATSTAAAATALGLLWTPSLASSSGWTDVSSGAASIVITGGALTGTVTGSTAPTNVGAATIPWAGSDAFDIRARVEVDGDTSVHAKAHLRVRYGADGLFLVADGNGGLTFLTTLGGFASLATATSRPIDGTGWVRLRIVGQRVTAWYGTGVGSAEPAATGWTLLYDADQAALLSTTGPTVLHLGGQNDSGGGLSVDTDFIWRAVTVRNLAGPV